jgi:hypothetical protein
MNYDDLLEQHRSYDLPAIGARGVAVSRRPHDPQWFIYVDGYEATCWIAHFAGGTTPFSSAADAIAVAVSDDFRRRVLAREDAK